MKKVIATVESFTNFIFHIQAIAKINYDNDYSMNYYNTIEKSDIAYLTAHKELLSFGNGCEGGLLTQFFIFLPAYINFCNDNQVIEYFDLLNESVQNEQPYNFINRYEKHFERLNLWLYQNCVQDIEQLFIECYSVKDIVYNFVQIYKRAYLRYINEVWKIEKEKIERNALILNERLSNNNFIYKWENITSYNFKTDKYEIVLCSAIESGPNANSLGYDRNVFYYASEINWLIRFISHEVGTHILIDIYKKYFNKYDSYLLYKCYESLAEFYNSLIFENESFVYNFDKLDCKRFFEIYGDIYSKNKLINPSELFKRGLEFYLCQSNGVN